MELKKLEQANKLKKNIDVLEIQLENVCECPAKSIFITNTSNPSYDDFLILEEEDQEKIKKYLMMVIAIRLDSLKKEFELL